MGLLFTNTSLAMMVLADLMRGWQQQQQQQPPAAAAVHDGLEGVLLPMPSAHSHTAHANAVLAVQVQAEDVLFGCGALAAVMGVAICHCVCGAMIRHDEGYRCFQPFKGGAPFVVFQGIGWLLFTLAILSVLTILYVRLSQIAIFGLASAAGCVFWVAQIVLWISLRLFVGDKSGQGARGSDSRSGEGKRGSSSRRGGDVESLTVDRADASAPSPSASGARVGWMQRWGLGLGQGGQQQRSLSEQNAVSVFLCVCSWRPCVPVSRARA